MISIAHPAKRLLLITITIFVSCLCNLIFAQADKIYQWGELYTRNMVSSETDLPTSFDPATGENIRWSVSLGSDGYAIPVVAGDKVLIGANNVDPKDPRHQGDRGIVLCLNKSDGSLYWQLVVPRIIGDRHNDWPRLSISSAPTIEGDRVYVITNRSQVVCLDLNGHYDGNDGTVQGEKWFMAPEESFSYEVTTNDADILWIYDLRVDLGMCPHDTPSASILIDGDILYLNTCTGVDYQHKESDCPDAPGLIALDKNTGELLATDTEHFGPRMFHAAWSSPALGVVKGKKLLFYGGPDGIMYAFEALAEDTPRDKIQTFKKVWQFDGDPTAPKDSLDTYLKNIREGPSGILGMPVFYQNRIYFTMGGDPWWGKREAWLKCIDATKTGDISETGELWSLPLERHSTSTPSISKGLVYVTDCGKNVHCVDAETGQSIWKHQLKSQSWSSTLVADNKIHVGSLGGDYWILEEGRTKCVVDSARFKAPIHTTTAVSEGMLFISTKDRLYAVEKEK